MSRLQKKPPAHKRGHPTLQNMNFCYFCGSFLPSWIRIRIRIQITDPDPMARLNTDPIRIRIRNTGFWASRIRIRTISEKYGSGSLYHQTKIVRKTLITTVFRLLYDFLSLKNDINVWYLQKVIRIH